MVTFYGAGERTGILNVEAKLGKILGKEKDAPLAIIVKGNAERISEAGMQKPADAFYNGLKKRLEDRGYRVEFDEGLDFTIPDQEAALWVGHSRGIDRLQFAEGPKTIALNTNDNFEALLKKNDFKVAADLNTKDLRHYQLADSDLSEIAALNPISNNTLVVKAADRDAVLSEISARMARYEKLDPDMYRELKALRKDVRDIFNKGLSPGDDIMEQLYFLDSKTLDLVEKLSRSYTEVVTPDDFQLVARIMSEKLRIQVPILKDFTKFFGRLAEDYLSNAKPSQSAFAGDSLLKTLIFGEYKAGAKLPKWLSAVLGIKDEAIREKILRRIPGYVPDSLLDNVISGVRAPDRRRTGFKIGKYSLFSEDITSGIEIGVANKLEKSWQNVPWVNFDKVTLEQNFTQVFEEKLAYRDADGKWITNIIQVQQKTAPNWWEELRNKDNKINDIADVSKARTAYAVNGNHSNDAVIVKQFHLWGRKNNIQTSTVHDAFVTNAADMLEGRKALRDIYAKAIESNTIKDTLDEMLKRGLPIEIYEKYLNEAIDIGLIPVAGRSMIDGKLMTEADILKKADILASVPERFKENRYFYGIG